MASVVPAARRPARSRFYLYMTVLFLVIAVVGFSTTFFLPLARGTLRIPRFMHIHGLLLFGWLGFLILQAWLIDRRSHMTHRKLGWLGASIRRWTARNAIALPESAINMTCTIAASASALP